MNKLRYLIYIFLTILLVGCSDLVEEVNTESQVDEEEETTEPESKDIVDETLIDETEEDLSTENKSQANADIFEGYRLIKVDGGDLSGYREPNVVVNIGFGSRKYWAFTNDYGQLVRVIADEIILQDSYNEPVLENGRYYPDEAKVPGVESDDLDEGHVIADSLGGVSNAYNITPQNSGLNRYGDQAYMERAIRDAGGATNFEAIITYPNTRTQIPSHYQYTYYIRGEKILESFDNVDPDIVNQAQNTAGNKTKGTNNSNKGISGKGSSNANISNSLNNPQDVSKIDINGDGQVTIKEAKAAGFKMPITKDHWLYKYMHDGDGDGMVGE